MDKEKSIVPNQIGYLVLKDDGAVLESGGELKNDEHSANVIMGLLNLTESIDESFMPNSSCERITIDYEEYYYSICMSNRRIYIVKISGSQNGGNTTTTATASSSSSNSVYNDASDSAGAVLA